MNPVLAQEWKIAVPRPQAYNLWKHRKYYEVQCQEISRNKPKEPIRVCAGANPPRKYHGVGNLTLVIESEDNSSLEISQTHPGNNTRQEILTSRFNLGKPARISRDSNWNLRSRGDVVDNQQRRELMNRHRRDQFRVRRVSRRRRVSLVRVIPFFTLVLSSTKSSTFSQPGFVAIRIMKHFMAHRSTFDFLIRMRRIATYPHRQPISLSLLCQVPAPSGQ